MPTYDYRCRKCGHQFELFHGIKDDAPRRCPKCRGIAQRVPTGGAGVLFKGTGFYVTDYRSRAYKEKARQEKSAGGGSGSSSGGSDSAGGKSDSKGGKGDSKGGKSDSAGGKAPSGG
jgi:putative FmdB family regulatory protein